MQDLLFLTIAKRWFFSLLLKTSKEGDSTASLENLFHYCTVLMGKESFPEIWSKSILLYWCHWPYHLCTVLCIKPEHWRLIQREKCHPFLVYPISDYVVLTIQSCIILFQSSPVTILNSTVMALPADEKFACLIFFKQKEKENI